MDLNYKSHSENYVGKNVWNFGLETEMCPFEEEPAAMGFVGHKCIAHKQQTVDVHFCGCVGFLLVFLINIGNRVWEFFCLTIDPRISLIERCYV